MKCLKQINCVRVLLALMIVSGFVVTASAQQAPAEAPESTEAFYTQSGRADETCDHKCYQRKGWLIGFNAGWGGTSYAYKSGNNTISEEGQFGATGAFRFGYAVSNSVAFTLEGFGFGVCDNDNPDWGVGAGFAAVTWWPSAGGFFVRAGVGAGGGEFLRRGQDKVMKIDDAPAALFSLGYEWRLTRSFGLGVSVDGFGLSLEACGDSDNYDDEWIGVGSTSVQFNWYL